MLLQLTDQEALLSAVMEAAFHIFQPDMGAILLLNQDRTTLVPVKSRGLPERFDLAGHTPGLLQDLLSDADTVHAIQHKAIVFVEDASQSDSALKPLSADLGVGSALGVSIVAAGTSIGLLWLSWKRIRRVSSDEQDNLVFCANMLGAALERIRLIHEAEAVRIAAESRAWELESRAELSAQLREAHSPEQLAETFVSHLGKSLNTACTLLFRLHTSESAGQASESDQADTLHLMAWYGADLSERDLSDAPVLRRKTPFLKKVCGARETLLLPGEAAAEADRLTENERSLFGDILAQAAFKGIRTSGNVMVGLFVLTWPQQKGPPQLSDAQQRLLISVSETAANALRRASTMDSLEQRVADRTAELEEANQRLMELDRLKSKFISDISHELRTPVTNLSFYLNLMEHGRLDKRSQYLRVLRTETARLTQMIEDTLDLSRLEQHLDNMNMAPMDLGALLVELRESYQVSFAAKGLSLQVAQESLVPVLADQNRIHQALAHVITNSLQFTQKGGVAVRGFPVDGWVCVEVADTGIGIPADEVQRVFDRFFRARNATEAGMVGPGLGLSIAQKIVEMHGGHITLESREGEGTTVCIRLKSA